jgi:hypothetical protein
MSQALLDTKARIDKAYQVVTTITKAYNALAKYFLKT